MEGSRVNTRFAAAQDGRDDDDDDDDENTREKIAAYRCTLRTELPVARMVRPGMIRRYYCGVQATFLLSSTASLEFVPYRRTKTIPQTLRSLASL